MRSQALFTVAAEYTIPKTKFEVFAEIVETTASRPSKHADYGDPNSIFGSAGFRYHFKDSMLNSFIRATYDDQHAFNIMIGMTTHFGRKDEKEHADGEKRRAASN